MRISLDVVIDAATASLMRFPWALASAIVASFVSIYAIEVDSNDEIYLKIVQICSLALPLFLAASLHSERQQFSMSYSLRYKSAILALLALYFFLLPEKITEVEAFRFSLFWLAAHLLVAFSPYITHNELNGFWQYNQHLFMRFLAAVLNTTVLYIGITIALLAISVLFGIEIPGKRYAQFWVFMAGVFNTWFFLADLPKDFEALEQDRFYPKPLKIFTQYVLLPLVGLYLLILYSYMLKIIIEWELPNGWVTYLVIAFSVAGIFSLLLVYPVQEEAENQWIKVFGRWFYVVLLPLIGLLFVAIGRRILDYGVTEPRYFVILTALWLLAISLYFLLSKVRDIKLIPKTLCLIFLLAAVGPWSAFKVSEMSQIKRFRNILAKYELLDESGRVKQSPKPPKMKEVDRNNIRSIMSFLSRRERLENLQPLFEQNLDSLLKDEVSAYKKEEKILSLIGGEDFSENLDLVANNLNFNIGKAPDVRPIKGYDYWLNFSQYSDQDQANSQQEFRAIYGNTYVLQVNAKKNTLRLLNKKDNQEKFTIYLKDLIKNLVKNYDESNYDVLNKEMQVVEAGQDYEVFLQIQDLEIERLDKQRNKIRSIRGELMLRLKKP